MLKMTKMKKAIILGLVLALVVFSAAACGVDEEELEELDEMDEDPIEDDFGFELDFEADTYAAINSSAIAL